MLKTSLTTMWRGGKPVGGWKPVGSVEFGFLDGNFWNGNFQIGSGIQLWIEYGIPYAHVYPSVTYKNSQEINTRDSCTSIRYHQINISQAEAQDLYWFWQVCLRGVLLTYWCHFYLYIWRVQISQVAFEWSHQQWLSISSMKSCNREEDQYLKLTSFLSKVWRSASITCATGSTNARCSTCVSLACWVRALLVYCILHFRIRDHPTVQCSCLEPGGCVAAKS